MTIKHPAYLCILAGVVFIGPNSEALLSNEASFAMNEAGYHCTYGQETRNITISYYDDPIYNQVCDVKDQLNNGKKQTLWNHQRSAYSCETKAGAMAFRLKDRGWQCQISGLSVRYDG